MGRNRVRLVACLGVISLFCGVSSASAQTPPSLGAAQSFAVLGGGSVTAAGAGTVITGDVGVSPGVVDHRLVHGRVALFDTPD